MSLSIGERLAAARKAKNLSLEDAVRSTKIQRRTLEAIEEDRVGEDLAPVYAKIFLKKYATFLGLDGAVLVDEYLNLRGPIPEASLIPQTETTTKRPALPALRQIFIPAGVGLMFLIGLSFLGYLAMDLYGALSKRSEKVVHSLHEKKPLSQKPAAPKSIVPRGQPLKLTIRTKADVWMQVKSDGTVIFQNVLPKDSQESWTAKEELELWTGNAGAMELILNGTPLGNPGTGVKKGIKVTHEGLKQ